MTVQMPIRGALHPVEAAAAPARVVALSAQRAAIFFDVDATAVGAGARLVTLCQGVPLAGPVAVSRLDRLDGGVRFVLLVARSAVELCATSIRIEAAGAGVAHIDPLALQTPLVDPLALVAGLAETGSLRLLKLLLTTGASLFGKGDLGGFGALVGQLVEGLTSAVPLAAWCAVGRTGAVLSWRLPTDAKLPPLRDLCVLHERRATRFTGFTSVEEDAGEARLLHLMLSRPLPEGADLIILGDRPVRLGGPAGAAARPLHGWMERRGAETRARVLDWLDGLAAGDARVAALRDETAWLPDAAPRVGVLHLSETPAGLLYLLSVDDPRGLIASLRIDTAGGSVTVPCAALQWHPRHGGVVAGFAPSRGRSGGAASVVPVYRSGRSGTPVWAAPAIYDGGVPQAFEGMDEEAAARALAPAIPSAMRARPVWRCRVAEFGHLPRAPRAALIVMAGEALEHLHAVLASLAAERGGRSVEVILVHAEGPSSEPIRRAAESLSAVHRLGLRLVSIAAEATPSEQLRAALAEATAARVLVLGPGCLPAGEGWLGRWRRRIPGGAEPRALRVETASHYDGADRGGVAVALNAAAVARLMSSRPVLPEIAADLAATNGLRVTAIRRVPVVSYRTAGACGLARRAAEIVVDAARETTDA